MNSAPPIPTIPWLSEDECNILDLQHRLELVRTERQAATATFAASVRTFRSTHPLLVEQWSFLEGLSREAEALQNVLSQILATGRHDTPPQTPQAPAPETRSPTLLDRPTTSHIPQNPPA